MEKLESLSKEVEGTENQMEILELKNMVNEIETLFIDSIAQWRGQIISKLKNRISKITHSISKRK